MYGVHGILDKSRLMNENVSDVSEAFESFSPSSLRFLDSDPPTSSSLLRFLELAFEVDD